MIICDRHFETGDHVLATRKVSTSTSENFELCESCFDEFKQFLAGLKKKKEVLEKPKKTRRKKSK